MIGRKGLVGLSLLCAVAFCALAAPNAIALKGTTAFTCAFEKPSFDFSDPHCDHKVKAGAGAYAHVEIKENQATKVVVTNEGTKNSTTESTSATLKVILAGVELDISCTTVQSEGSLKNTKTAAGQMEVEAPAAEVHYSGCKLTKPVNGKGEEVCQVKEGKITATATTTTYVSEAGEMGVEFNPPAGKNFTEVTLEDAPGKSCVLKNTYPITGTAVGTPTNNGTEQEGSGATLSFDASHGSLKLGASAASLTQTLTVKTLPEEGKAAIPISLTTTAS
jgi:hypothetical protein